MPSYNDPSSCLSLFSDTVVTTLLAEWQLTCDYFDGDWLNGPVPRLSAPDLVTAKAALDRDPSKGLQGYPADPLLHPYLRARVAGRSVGVRGQPKTLGLHISLQTRGSPGPSDDQEQRSSTQSGQRGPSL
jgi:hypothetical protein